MQQVKVFFLCTAGDQPQVRLAYEKRFTGIIANRFPQHHIIEEGLPGRTICIDDPLDRGRNGMETLPMLLQTHEPLDLVVIMLGEIRIINMQFAHGYHSSAVETNDPGTKWRVTPEKAGPSYVLGDVGTHALFLAETMVPDLKIEKLMCARQSFVKSRAPLEDNAFVLLQYDNGAVGNLWASCVNAGSTHQQKIRVVGEKASIEWWDEHPNQIIFAEQGKPVQILDRGQGYLYQNDEAITCDRMGGGHAEGLFESWANLYRRFGTAMDRVNRGENADAVMSDLWFPNIRDGAEGVRFIENCVRSSDVGSAWVDYQ